MLELGHPQSLPLRLYLTDSPPSRLSLSAARDLFCIHNYVITLRPLFLR